MSQDSEARHNWTHLRNGSKDCVVVSREKVLQWHERKLESQASAQSKEALVGHNKEVEFYPKYSEKPLQGTKQIVKEFSRVHAKFGVLSQVLLINMQEWLQIRTLLILTMIILMIILWNLHSTLHFGHVSTPMSILTYLILPTAA